MGNRSPKTVCLSLVEQPLAESVANGLPSNIGSVCRQEYVHDAAAYCGNWETFMLPDVLGREIGSMNRDPFGALPAQSCRRGNGKIYARRVCIGDAIEQQGRLTRKGDVFWPLAGLRPQHGIAVLCETVHRVVCNPIDTPGHAHQPATLR